MKPAYLKLHASGELRQRSDAARQALELCRMCPRRCDANRMEDELGTCRVGRCARVASYRPHFREEAPLVGRHGSGTIFFSSCNLFCTFCQNYAVSHLREGYDVDAAELASMMIELQTDRCHNINLVSPSHVVPQILEAVDIAARRGLRVPLVYNTGSYDGLEALRLLDGVVDIYMPDFKFWEAGYAEQFCKAYDYPQRAREAVKEMHRQVGDLIVNAEGVAVRGLLVRHLVMPNGVSSTGSIMAFLAGEISRETYVNVMSQYRPCGRAIEEKMISRAVNEEELREAVQMAREAGLHRLMAG